MHMNIFSDQKTLLTGILILSSFYTRKLRPRGDKIAHEHKKQILNNG